mmetsp:Transcript_6720/g.20743  ORF Transcript_6720/g.20743 Transcript_6720/m.20743 type:complete len:238 (-) Transcript_6720:480-1193(-)
MANDGEADALDRVIKFLGKREGIDKTLKLVRYGAKLVAATTRHEGTHVRAKALDKSLGTTRKAFRLGKFLKDVDSLRKSRATGYLYLLEALAYGGEGVYFFIEQGVWLAKAGVLSAEQEKQLAYLSVWWEFIGYTGSISLSLIKLRELSYKEAILHASFEQKRVQQGVLDMSLNRQLASVRALKALRTAAIVQDIADAAIAINDILGGDLPMLGHPVTLALAGLLSGSISAHKNWNA